MKKLKNIMIIVIMQLIVMVNTFSIMSIGPIYFNHRIDGEGGYQEYTIENDSFSTVRYKMGVVPVTEDKELYQKMKNWIEIYPKVLTIKPKSSEKVKVLIKADEDAKIGEYRFRIEPQPIYIPELNEDFREKKPSSVRMRVPFVLMMEVEGYVGNLGDIRKDIEITKIKNGIEIVNNMQRRGVLEVETRANKKRYVEIIKLEKGERVIKKYKGVEEIKVREAATQEEIIKIEYFLVDEDLKHEVHE